MLRRTLLCAVLAFPLAAKHLPSAMALQAAWCLICAWLSPRAGWYAPGRNGALMRRTVFALALSFAFTGTVYILCQSVFSAAFSPAFTALSFFSGVLLQSALVVFY